jgi:transcriptional regulator with XRE-family HTH domain
MDDTLNRIQEQLKLHKMSKIQLLTFLGLTKSAWSSWERGETTTYKDHIPEIAGLFNVSADYLLGIEQKNKPVVEHDELSNEILNLFIGLSEKDKTELIEYARYKFEHQSEK